jgi:hypothetical protein
MWNSWQAAGHLGLWARQPLNLDLVWAALGLVAAVLVGVIVIVWVQRWQKRSADPGDPQAELDNYRALCERGLLSSEELERIRTRLEGNKPKATAQDSAKNGTSKPDQQLPPQGLP